MNMRQLFTQKRYIILITCIVVGIAVMAGTKLYGVVCELHNQRVINQTISFLDSHPKADARPALEQLLALKNLTVKQHCDIYAHLADVLYASNSMNDFTKQIGSAIFYSVTAGEPDITVRLYALIARYYLSVGADTSAFDMILEAQRQKDFYKVEDPFAQCVALHAYARFLVSERKFDEALRAQDQMEKAATLLSEKDPAHARHLFRTALVFKAYVLMNQGKTEEAYALVNETYERFKYVESIPRHIEIYDFLLAVNWVRVHWALATQHYDKALQFYHAYASAAEECNYIMKETMLLKEILFSLPDLDVAKRNQFSLLLSKNTNMLAQFFLDNYTALTGERLKGAFSALQFSEARRTVRIRTFQTVLVLLIFFMVFLLILFAIYDETQTDGLTRLRNRRSLNSRIGKLVASGRRYSAIMIDLDNFKRLNDTFGHEFGDDVLRGVAAVLIKAESKNIKSYRYGGEEMVIILEHFDLENAVKFSESVRNAIAQLKWCKDVQVTASVGLGFEMPDSLKEADENMYVAKQKGKNFTAYRKNGKQYLAERRLDIREEMPDK